MLSLPAQTMTPSVCEESISFFLILQKNIPLKHVVFGISLNLTSVSRHSVYIRLITDEIAGRRDVRTSDGEEEGICVSSSGWVSFSTPSLQLSSSPSDESLVRLYLSLSDEVELMATFTPPDVIIVQPGAVS